MNANTYELMIGKGFILNNDGYSIYYNLWSLSGDTRVSLDI